jgi:CubicO group peptidase (beta-lactamase class C family)
MGSSRCSSSSSGVERVVALLREGIASGWHRGAQLEVRRRGFDPITVCVGESRPGIEMTPATLLPWFSCTKPFTAVAVAQLVERGAVSFDDPVAAHVPEFAAEGKAEVTIRHVLTHTGGFRAVQPPADVWRLEWDELVARICASPLEPGWVPGARAGYHPVTGFHVLGEVIQRASGRSFADYVTEEILEPLDLADSWMQLTEERYAGYGDRMGVMEETARPGGAASTPVRGMDSWRGFRRASPAGGGVGPMGDLVKLFEALLGGGAREGERVLSDAMTAEIVRAHRVGMRDETFGMVIDWGLGLMVNSWHHRREPARYGYGDHASAATFGHGGQQSSLAFGDPEHGLAVALCCNGRPGEVLNHRRTQPVITALYEELGLAGHA